MSTILILGAAGRLGSAALVAFKAAGWIIRAQVRPGTAHRLPADVTPVEVDGSDCAGLAAAAVGVDVVFQGLNPLYTAWDRDLMPITDAAIAAWQASGGLLLFPGNVYGYGAGMPETLTPTTPQHPTTQKGRLRVAVEEKLIARAKSSNLKLAILRAGDFFGGDRPGTWLDLVIAKDIAKGKLSSPAPLGIVHAFAYLPDLARAFVAMANARQSLPSVEIANFAGHNVTMAEMLASIEKAAGRKMKIGYLPWWLLALISPFAPMIRALREMRYLWTTPHRLVDATLGQRIGSFVATPFDQAVRDSLADLKLIA